MGGGHAALSSPSLSRYIHLLTFLITVVGIILTLLLIIGIHELGHFLAARFLGIKVLRFSIGFGKTLWSRYDKKGTQYVLAAIPLGGYVKMLDENEQPISLEESYLAFNRQPFYKKCIIVLAGPLANFLLAFFLYWLLFIIGFQSLVPIVGKVTPHSIAAEAGIQPNYRIVSIDQVPTSSWMSVIIRILSRSGDTDKMTVELAAPLSQVSKNYQLNLTHWHMDDLKPDPLASLGIQLFEPEVPPIIDKILPHSPALGILQTGDKILTVNNIKITDWLEFVAQISHHPAEKITLVLERKGKKQTVQLVTDSRRGFLKGKYGWLGVIPYVTWPKGVLQNNKYNVITALFYAWQNTYDFIHLNLRVIGKLLMGKVSLQSLGGPIAIFQNAGIALNQGMAPFLSFLAFLSISVGVINILPIPGLDGGHLLFQLIEAFLKRPIPERILLLSYRLGLIALFLLIFQSLINDMLRF